jgi:hypothetical protein
MQTGKSGSYVCARAGAAAETTPIAKIAKAGMRMGPSLRIDGTASPYGNRPPILIPVNSRSLRKTSYRLNARAVATIAKNGRHADGGGLYLSISPNGGRRWVFLFRWQGKPTEIGFGSARDVTLARARELASQAWAKLAEGAIQGEGPRKAQRSANALIA